jgi:uncharacterized protein (TIGR02246 family)
MKTIVLAAAVALAISSACFAQAPASEPPEKAEILANERAYEAAYAKADIKALADAFSDDADYITDSGDTYSGREAIEGAIRAGLAANRGSKLAIEVASVRLLGADTLIAKGSTTVTAKNGESSSSLYTAVRVKKDGKWKISQLIESPLPTLTPRDHLDELAWLIGDWEETDKTDELTVSSQYAWARGGNYITRNVTVKRAGDVTLEGWQIIGWDPVDENIRTWTFDTEGGFAEGRLTREGDRWLLREVGVTPDGSRSGADNTITKVSPDKLTFESNNRTLNGSPQPSIGRIEISRVKGN